MAAGYHDAPATYLRIGGFSASWFLIGIMPLLMVFSLLRSMQYLAFTSTLGNTVLAAVVVAVVVSSVSQGLSVEATDLVHWSKVGVARAASAAPWPHLLASNDRLSSPLGCFPHLPPISLPAFPPSPPSLLIPHSHSFLR